MILRVHVCLRWAWLVIGALVLSAGCGHREPGVVPVRGTITLNGGPWPKEGTLTFTPVETGGQGEPYRPGRAVLRQDGSFRATTYTEGDGLYPGTYQVAIECWEVEPKIADDGRMLMGKSYVPERYQNSSTSGLSFTVDPSGRNDPIALDVQTE